MDTWYIVSKERHEGLSWWHRQVQGLSEPQRIQEQPGQFIETLSQSKSKSKSKIKKKKSQRDNHNPDRKGISATVLRSTSVAVCTPNPNTHINIPLFLKWGDAAQFT